MLSVLACGATQALPVGNPAEASLLCDGLFWEGSCCLDMCDPCTTWCDALSFRVGYYGDFVFNRHLRISSCEHNADIEDTEIFTNAGYIALNAWDRIDLFFNFGATNIFLRANAKKFGGLDGRCLELETETNWSWGIGLRATIWECGCTTLGAEGQYFFTRPNINRVSIGCEQSEYPSSCVDFKYHEWQFGIGIAHRINLLVPYIAVKWAKVKSDLGDAVLTTLVPAINLHDLENSRDFGYAFGVSLVDCEKAAVTVEARFVDEKAIYVNGQIRL